MRVLHLKEQVLYTDSENNLYRYKGIAEPEETLGVSAHVFEKLDPQNRKSVIDHKAFPTIASLRQFIQDLQATTG